MWSKEKAYRLLGDDCKLTGLNPLLAKLSSSVSLQCRVKIQAKKRSSITMPEKKNK
jgi:hypothetical protein